MDTIVYDEIRQLHRTRVFLMDSRKRSEQALAAFLRTQLGWNRDLPKNEAAEILATVKDYLARGAKAHKSGAIAEDEDEDFKVFAPIIIGDLVAREAFAKNEANVTKQMEKLAKTLPVWKHFGEGVRGFGARSLAVVIGETGNLSNYATHQRLWKRMGLAVMSGVRQGGLSKGSKAEDWIAHGYSASRRSQMFVIGECLIKCQGKYRDVYLERKAFEREKAEAAGLTVAPSAKIPEKRKDEFMSEGHIHRRAQRFMEKQLLRDLWGAWRQTNVHVNTRSCLSAASTSSEVHASA